MHIEKMHIVKKRLQKKLREQAMILMKTITRMWAPRRFYSSLAYIIVLGIVITAMPLTLSAQERFYRDVTLATGGVEEITLAPGHTMTIATDRGFSDMVVGNPGVADVFPLTDSSLYIQGISSGFTNVAVYDEQKELLGIFNIRVRRDFSELTGSIQAAVPSANVDVENINNRVRLSGSVKDNVDLIKVLEVAAQYTEEPIINSIRIRDLQQVMLQVRILEVERNAGRALGVNLTGVSSSGNVSTTGRAAQGGSVQPFGSFVGNLLTVAGVRVDFVINALEEKGLARRLADPSLVTLSGVEANFVVGGEVPIQTVTTGENGSTTSGTDFREYGVRLNFTPTVLDKGLVRLRINPEVSDIDRSVENIRGEVGFITRSADTTVMLRDGQSFAIAGLFKSDNSRNIDQVPWLGSVPILGSLFRSTAYQKKETDLVILVTPKIVRPARPGEPLVSPLDKTRSSDDVELFLLGMLEVDKDMIRGFHDGAGIIGPYGHIIDLEFDDALLKKK